MHGAPSKFKQCTTKAAVLSHQVDTRCQSSLRAQAALTRNVPLIASQVMYTYATLFSMSQAGGVKQSATASFHHAATQSVQCATCMQNSGHHCYWLLAHFTPCCTNETACTVSLMRHSHAALCQNKRQRQTCRHSHLTSSKQLLYFRRHCFSSIASRQAWVMDNPGPTALAIDVSAPPPDIA